MSAGDKPEDNGSKLPVPGADEPVVHGKTADTDPLRRKAVRPERRRPPTSIWLDHDRTPAQGLVYAIPAGLALWVGLIYVLKKFL